MRVCPRVSRVTFRFLSRPWRQETVTAEPIKGHFKIHKFHKARLGKICIVEHICTYQKLPINQHPVTLSWTASMCTQ